MNKETFLSFGVKPHKVQIENLGKEIYIRELSYTSLMALRQCKDMIEQSFVAVIGSVCDESGNLLFTENDAPLIADSMSWYAIQEIASKVAEVTTTNDNDLVK
ncbi:hypothetical protein L4D00_14965 [Photobacterium swingsii]|uniref:hypothetical protein n=1 Tax=Photobacterium swingsii TaxID=680026 RepID=UPI003D136817